MYKHYSLPTHVLQRACCLELCQSVRQPSSDKDDYLSSEARFVSTPLTSVVSLYLIYNDYRKSEIASDRNADTHLKHLWLM